MTKAIDETLVKAYNDRAVPLGLLPIKVPPSYDRLVQEEVEALGFTGGPLYRIVYPVLRRLDTRSVHEVPDYVEDRTNMPSGLEGMFIHKYRNRALFLVTDKCAGHCMYCFRQDVISDLQKRAAPSLEEKIRRVVDYLAAHPEVRELILSGGDPLNVPLHYLEHILAAVRALNPQIRIRVHSRNVIFAPRLVSEPVCRLLGAYRVRVYLHVVHPYELTDDVTDAIGRMQAHGVRTYSQFPILRGVNDHVAVLKKLLESLDDLHVHPINLFIPDPINYSAPFRISLDRLLGLMDELYWNTSSWINGVRLVMDTPVGKVRREDITNWNRETGVVTFQREGQGIVYHDFPKHLDVPGRLETLLWREHHP